MKSVRFEEREAWLLYRLGKLTGSTVKDFVGSGRSDVKPGIYRAAAESIIGSAAIEEGELTSVQAMARGQELEPVAIARFEKETGKKVTKDLVAWEHEEDPRLMVSPDGVIGKTAAIEVKCLLSPKHIEALYTRRIPKNTGGYEEQAVQYFVVNEKLKTLYYAFFHPAFPAPLDFFYLTFTRKELAEKVAAQTAAEHEAAAKVRSIVNALSLYSPDDIARMNAATDELIAGASTVEAEITSERAVA